MSKYRTRARWLSLFALVCAACSAESDDDRPGATPTGGVGGVAGAGGAAGISGVGGGVGGVSGNGAGGTGGSSVPQPPSPVFIDQCDAANPAGLTPDQVQQLTAGSGAPGTLRVLYPYDDTVFPRGMLAPTWMWDGAPAADAVYIRFKSASFEYKGCLKPTADGQLQIPQDVWDQAGAHTGGAADPFHVELSIWSGAAATGPATQIVEVAPATIKGSIYYNSYSSKLGGGGATMQPGMWGGSFGGSFGGGSGGMILRIPPKQSAQVFASSSCIGCHSLSANGARLLASSTMGGASFQLTPTTAPNPPQQNAGSRACFGALYPDGSVYLSSASNSDLAHCGSNPMGSQLVQTDDGSAVAGAAVLTNALMPTFSSDGTLIAFVDNDNDRVLATVGFDRATNATAYPVPIYTAPASEQRPAWPFALPDNKAVVYLTTNSPDYSGMGAGLGGMGGNQGDLRLVDLQSGTSLLLAKAMGFRSDADAASGTTYLPFGAAELHQSFFPTVSPVAAGGYFWVFFDAVRHYGNQGLQRQLWGAAIRVSADGSYAEDPSRPAFYVTGQEFGTGNHRAFTALDPCIAEGGACSSGVDCCGGFCTITSGDASAPTGTCGMPVEPRCSMTDEACSTKADCCNPNDLCIAGYCGFVVPE